MSKATVPTNSDNQRPRWERYCSDLAKHVAELVMMTDDPDNIDSLHTIDRVVERLKRRGP